MIFLKNKKENEKKKWITRRVNIYFVGHPFVKVKYIVCFILLLAKNNYLQTFVKVEEKHNSLLSKIFLSLKLNYVY